MYMETLKTNLCVSNCYDSERVESFAYMLTAAVKCGCQHNLTGLFCLPSCTCLAIFGDGVGERGHKSLVLCYHSSSYTLSKLIRCLSSFSIMAHRTSFFPSPCWEPCRFSIAIVETNSQYWLIPGFKLKVQSGLEVWSAWCTKKFILYLVLTATTTVYCYSLEAALLLF